MDLVDEDCASVPLTPFQLSVSGRREAHVPSGGDSEHGQRVPEGEALPQPNPWPSPVAAGNLALGGSESPLQVQECTPEVERMDETGEGSG